MAVQNNQKIHDSACVSQLHGSEITVQPNLFSFLEIFKAQKFGMGFLAPFDHPCHLNLDCPPGNAPMHNPIKQLNIHVVCFWEGPWQPRDCDALMCF